MCGIAGVISGTEERLLETAVKMAAIASHRGPDGSSTCIASSTGWQFGGANELTWCALAHNRLAIIDLAPTSDQPIISKDGRFSLVYNGEIYNYQELRTELEISGVVFTSRGDAEVLLEALIKWGEKALPRLRGMFAFTFVRWSKRIGHKWHYIFLIFNQKEALRSLKEKQKELEKLVLKD